MMAAKLLKVEVSLPERSVCEISESSGVPYEAQSTGCPFHVRQFAALRRSSASPTTGAYAERWQQFWAGESWLDRRKHQWGGFDQWGQFRGPAATATAETGIRDERWA